MDFTSTLKGHKFHVDTPLCHIYVKGNMRNWRTQLHTTWQTINQGNNTSFTNYDEFFSPLSLEPMRERSPWMAVWAATWPVNPKINGPPCFTWKLQLTLCLDFNSDDVLIHLAKPVSHGRKMHWIPVTNQLSQNFLETSAESLKTREEDKEEKQAATASLTHLLHQFIKNGWHFQIKRRT